MVTDINQVISVQKTGGFAGLTFKFEQQLAKLNADRKAQLESLISDCRLRERPSVSEKSKNARDVFIYSFVLREGDTIYNASFDDTTLTPAYRALFQYIQSLNPSR